MLRLGWPNYAATQVDQLCCGSNGLVKVRINISDPFQIYHDFFPSQTEMGFIVNELISLSQYHTYRTQTMNLFHWNAGYELPCQLLTDNLAGLFQYFSKKNHDDPLLKEFIAKNKSILHIEKW